MSTHQVASMLATSHKRKAESAATESSKKQKLITSFFSKPTNLDVTTEQVLKQIPANTLPMSQV